MKRSTAKFGNCIDCNRYFRLDSEGRCPECASFDIQLVDVARKFILNYPDTSREKIAEVLDVDINRVDEWIRLKKIRCVSIRKVCPNCGNVIINRFYCDSCGFNAEPLFKEQEANQPKNIKRMAYQERVQNLR